MGNSTVVSLEAETAEVTTELRRERNRRAWRTARAGLVARGVGYAVRLAVIPLSLRLLGAEEYGLWLTIGSLIAWFGMTDLGITPGLVNAIAAASGRDDREEMRRLVSTGFFTFASLGGIVFLVALGAAQWDGIRSLLGVAQHPKLWRETSFLVMICGAFFALSMPLNAATSVATALQEGYLAAYSTVGSNLLNLASMATMFVAGASLTIFAIGMGAPTLVGTAALALYLFGRRYPELLPSPAWWSPASLKTIFGYGGPLMLVQIANLAILYSTNLLIANRLGPAQVAHYSVPYALFMLVSSTCYTIVSPYLPAYAEAAERGDRDWIRKSAHGTLATACCLMVGADVFFLAAGKPIIRLWAGPEMTPTPHFLLAMSGYFLAMTMTSTTGVLLIGLGRVGLKATLQCAVAVLYVAGTWLLLPRLGILAVPLAGIVAYSADLIFSLPYALQLPRWTIRRESTKTAT